MILSIVIPCFNHGKYIEDTLRSVLKVIDFSVHEVIILNDGSTDDYTNQKLEEIKQNNPEIQVLRHENMGLARTRNRGLEIAKGKYFLPLDSDNILTEEYIKSGIPYMEQHDNCIAVYGNSEMFGAKTGMLHNGPMKLQTILMYNYIDACALFRREQLAKIGGYDDKMPKHGMEDWELWIRIILGNHMIYHLNKTIQKYRVENDSMIRSYSKKDRDKNIDYINSKFSSQLNLQGVDDYYFSKFESSPFLWIIKICLRKYAPTLYQKLIISNRISQYL